MALLEINVNDEDLASVSEAMNIPLYPYIIVYFNGDTSHNIHGPANEETALQILQEIERITPKPVTIGVAQSSPLDFNGENPEESYLEARDGGRVNGPIKDVNREITEEDNWGKATGTVPAYDF